MCDPQCQLNKKIKHEKDDLEQNAKTVKQPPPGNPVCASGNPLCPGNPAQPATVVTSGGDLTDETTAWSEQQYQNALNEAGSVVKSVSDTSKQGLLDVLGSAASDDICMCVIGDEYAYGGLVEVGEDGSVGLRGSVGRGRPGEVAAGGASEVGGCGCTPWVDPRIGVDRGDGRDIFGRFTGSGGYGADAEAQGLANYSATTGRSVVSTRVRATLPDGSTRYYDGLSEDPSGVYQGVEVKSGTATRNAQQRMFDAQVDGGSPATATLNGVPIRITSTYEVHVP